LIWKYKYKINQRIEKIITKNALISNFKTINIEKTAVIIHFRNVFPWGTSPNSAKCKTHGFRYHSTVLKKLGYGKSAVGGF
jgi:hypothetical protein